MNKLGFGFLRLPQTRKNEIDWPLLEQMADEFISTGGSYFDTAYTYLDGRSETALKRAVVERYPRSSLPVYASIAQSNGKVSDCIHCHTCEQNCPQQIPITNWLKEVGKAFV